MSLVLDDPSAPEISFDPSPAPPAAPGRARHATVAPRAARRWRDLARRWIVAPLAKAAFIYGYVCAILMVFEDRLIFPGGLRPRSSEATYAAARAEAAAAIGRPVEEVGFTSADGTKLSGWFVEGEPDAPVVLILHGNASHVVDDARYLVEAHQIAGASALLLDYRGYGRSEGTATESGVLADARAARSWLAARCGIAERDVVLWGASLGGGVAIDLAQDGARGLLTEVTFTSLPDAAALRYFMFPVHLLMHNRMNSLEKIGRVTCPTFIAHGDRDTLVPYAHSERLFAASAAACKRHFRLAGLDHCTRWTPEMRRVREEFFAALVGGDSPRSRLPTGPAVAAR